MLAIRKHLLQAQHDLEERYEPVEYLINRLKQEGKSIGEIEQEVLDMNRIQGVYDSIEIALKILEL